MKNLKVIPLSGIAEYNCGTVSFGIVTALFLLFVHAHPVCAQNADACYTEMRREGIEYMNKKNYKDAINQFWTTLVVCKDKPDKDDLSDLIKEAQKRWVAELESAVVREQTAYREAIAAKEQAETAKSAEEKARKEAEVNAKKAREQGIKAESLRLSLLADMARQRGQKTDALLLSWMALQLSGPELSPHAMRSFGEAVCDTFSRSYFNSPQKIESAAYLPHSRKMLIKTGDGAFFIIGTGETSGATQLPQGLIEVVPSNTGNYLAAWDKINAVQIFNTEGAVIATLSGHTEAVRFAVFSPDDSQVLTCSRDNTARLWDLKGRQLAVLEGHSANVQSGCFSTDGSFILTRSSDGTARSWTKDGTALGIFGAADGYLKKATIHPASGQVVILTTDGDLEIYGKEGGLLRAVETGGQPVKEVVFATKSPLIAIKTGNNTVSLISGTGDLTAACKHSSTVSGIWLNTGGTHLLTWAKDRTVRLWDNQGKLLTEFKGHRGDITAAALSPGDLYVLTTSTDGTVKLWDLQGNILTEWILGNSPATPAFFSPEGPYFIATNNNCKSVSAAPFPMDVYRSVEPETVLQSEAAPKLMSQYNVQYTDELAGKK